MRQKGGPCHTTTCMQESAFAILNLKGVFKDETAFID